MSVEDIEDANLNIAHYFTEDNVDSIFGNVLVNKNTYENASTPKVELKELATIIRGMNTPPKKRFRAARRGVSFTSTSGCTRRKKFSFSS
ncbi:hypothetical protein OL548_32455 [Lysinibacillus sp. MHQ-1]|nr:hypothetical protein OL548_32455 [Lysinibacillus sp. MHQ-1]